MLALLAGILAIGLVSTVVAQEPVPMLVRDINTAPNSSNPTWLTPAGDQLFFVASFELWRSDGTAAGTLQLTDDDPSEYMSPHNLVAVGNTLYCVRERYGGVNELWRSDGTVPGTFKVFDFPDNIYGLTALGDLVVFVAQENATGVELWRSDGTAAGTSLIKDIFPGYVSSSPSSFSVVDGMLYFSADGGGGDELWRSDGTAAGTVKVVDIRPNFGGSMPFEVVPSGGWLYFSASPTGAGSDPSDIIAFGDLLLFPATEPIAGRELWRSDGTAAGTVRVADLNPGPDGSGPRGLRALAGLVYFLASDPATGLEMWRTDGTAGGTFRLGDLNPGPAGSNPGGLTALGQDVFFTASQPATGIELWTTDGTSAGTHVVADLAPGLASSFPEDLTVSAGALYFTADDQVMGKELWVYAPCRDDPSDGDGDGLCNAIDPCTSSGSAILERARVIVKGIDATAGDDSVTVAARFTMPPAAIDPIANGFRIELRDALGRTVLDATLPSGAYDSSSGVGWRRKGSRWRFSDLGNTHGIFRALVREIAPGRIIVNLRGRDSHYPVSLDALPLRFTVVADAPVATLGGCIDASFTPGECEVGAADDAVRCRR